MKKAFVVSLVAAAVVALAWSSSAALRAACSPALRKVADKIDANVELKPVELEPVAMVDDCMAKMQKQRDIYQSRRDVLYHTSGDLARKIAEKDALLCSANAFAEEFAAALDADAFPVVVRERAYTKDEATSQLRLLLSEIDLGKKEIDSLKSAKSDADSIYENTTLKVSTLETQCETLKAQREIFKTKKITEEDSNMFDQCLKMLTENEQELELASPIRTAQEIAQDAERASKDGTSDADKRLEAYMNEFRAKKEAAL